MKTMKKKVSAVIMAMLAILVIAVAFVGCEDTNKPEPEKTQVSVKFVIGNQTVETSTVKKGETVTPYDSGEWYTDEEFKSAYDFTKAVNDDITLYGRAEFTVTFAGEVQSTASVKRGGKVELPSITVPNGKTAIWKLGEAQFDENERFYRDVTITLVYEDLKFSVKILGCDDREVYSTVVNYGEDVDLNGKEELVGHIYPDFYSFAGWDSSAEDIKSDTIIRPKYNYNSLPEEIFSFKLLSDDTYAIELKDHYQDYNPYNFTGCMGLPEEYNGKPVTVLLPRGIYNYNSDYLSGLDKFLIPSSYRRIMGEALFYLRMNGDIYIGEGVEKIYACAFQNLSQYDNTRPLVVHLPSTLKLIEKFALADLIGEVTLADGKNYIWKNKSIFSADGKTLVYVSPYDKELTEYTIGEDVKEIYPYLFNRIQYIKSVTIKGDREELPVGMFYEATALEEVKIEGKVKRICGTEKRYNEIIGYGEFDCMGKQEIMEVPSCPFIGSYFKNDVDFELPEGLVHIGDRALEYLAITDFTVPKELEYLGNSALNSEKLEHISVEAGNPKFYGEDCVIAKGLGENGGDKLLLYPCASPRTEFDIPEGVTSFGMKIFYGVKNLHKLTVPEGITKLPREFLTSESMFNDEGQIIKEAQLKELVLPSTLKHIGWMDPDGNDNSSAPCIFAPGLEKISFPGGNNVEIIEEMSIICNVTEIELGAKCTQYGRLGIQSDNEQKYVVDDDNPRYRAYDGILYEISDGKLLLLRYPQKKQGQNVDLGASEHGGYEIAEIKENAFAGNAIIESITIPEGVTKIGNEAFYNCFELKNVVLPASLTEIGSSAFAMCNLDSVTFKSEKTPTMNTDGFYPPFFYEEINWDTGETVYSGPGENIVFNIPAGEAVYDSYHKAMELFGLEWAKKVSASGVNKITYRFVTNGGTPVSDVQSVYLYERPTMTWAGEGSPNFLGWYLKDGTLGAGGVDPKKNNDEAWGERVSFVGYAFKGIPDENGVCTLYARWSYSEEILDGSYPEHAFILTEERSEWILSYGASYYYFRFTAPKTGDYNLAWDENFIFRYRVMCLEEIDGEYIPLNYGRLGFRLEAGKIYYFYSLVAESYMPIDWEAPHAFWVNCISEE